MRQTFRAITTFILLLSLSPHAPAAVFQYTVPIKQEKGEQPAFLWVPPDAKQLRGVIMVGMTVMEKEFSKDPVIRKACADQQIAIIFMKAGLSQTNLQKVLDDLAAASGYKELSVAPLFFLGHSANGPPAHDMAVKYADRCFGVVQYRGGGPFDGKPVPPGIPSLCMLGQFDEYNGVMRREGGHDVWTNFAERLAAFRGADANNLASMVVEPGAGHFAWSDRNATYLAMFISKAAKARIPESWPIDSAQPPTMLQIDAKTGWLTSLNLRAPGDSKPAAFDQYTGDKSTAAWHFDKEVADATFDYNVGYDMKDQFVKWKDNVWIDAGTRHFHTDLKWVDDGQTLELHPAYSETYPADLPEGKGPKWLQAGEPCGHSDSPILVKTVAGAAVPVGPNKLRIQFDNLSPAADGARGLNFMAYSAGDKQYRYTEQIGMVNRGFSTLKDGQGQSITFPPIGNLKTNSAPVELNATSSSKLTVEYYVAVGPAMVTGGKLSISELPARATYPITVKVVAYQYGSGIAPKVQTAAPVEQTILIEKP